MSMKSHKKGNQNRYKIMEHIPNKIRKKHEVKPILDTKRAFNLTSNRKLEKQDKTRRGGTHSLFCLWRFFFFKNH